MYDTFSEDYDRFINWPGRLALEMPFIDAQLNMLHGEPRSEKSGPAVQVLDAAAGTGMHAIALAERGYQVAAADLSAAMIDRAHRNIDEAGVKIRLEVAGFGSLAGKYSPGSFDAVLCLGNSLPHALTPEDLAAALHDFAACLRPGGLLLVQNRNFDSVLAEGDRWMEPQTHREGDVERVFLRFYDFEPAGMISFNVVTLRRMGGGPWSQRVMTTRLRPLVQSDLITALAKAGFSRTQSYGNMLGDLFDPSASSNLVTVSWLES